MRTDPIWRRRGWRAPREGTRRAVPRRLTFLLLGALLAGVLPSCLAWHSRCGPPHRLRSQKSAVALAWPRGARDVRGVIHAHCYLSSDSEGSTERIAAAARASGVCFVALTDHPSDRFIDAAPRGLVDGIWFLPGGELRARSQKGSILGVDLRTTPERHPADDRGVVASIVAAGGLPVLAHVEKLSRPDVDGARGFEIVNLHAMVQALGPLSLALRGLFLTPASFARSVIERPDDNIEVLGRLLAAGRTLTVTGGCDAHENVRFLGLVFGTYEEMFRAVTTHVLVDGAVSGKTIRAALDQGRSWAAVEAFGSTEGFVFVAGRADASGAFSSTGLPGDRVVLEDGSQLRATAPGHPRFILRRASRVVATAGVEGLVYTPTEPGAYWLEVLHNGEDPWIYTSAILIEGGRDGHR